MTRFGCTGDLHIYPHNHGEDRLADQDALLDEMVEVARDKNVDAMLIAGDVFHKPKPGPRELHVFQRFAKKLERACIPTIAILGNAGHDQWGTDDEAPTALELFGNGDWMRVSRRPELIKTAGDVAVCTLPSVPPNRLRALLADRGETGDVNQLAAAMLIEIAADLRSQVPAGWPAILLPHWSVSGAATPTGLSTTDLDEPVLPLDELEQLGYDAIVMAHIHKRQSLGTTAGAALDYRIFYVGSPGCWNFGEANDRHGFTIIDVGDGAYSAEFVELHDRRFVTLDTDLVESQDIAAGNIDETDLIAIGIAEEIGSLDGAIVRIRYRATEEQARRVDVQALKSLCYDAGAHRVFQIVPEIVRATRARSEGVDEQLDPQAALAAWCKANDVDEAQAGRVARLLEKYSTVSA